MFESLDQVMRKQMGKRQLEIHPGHPLRTNEDSFEERLVEGTSDAFGRLGVGLGAVGGEFEGCVEIALDLIEADTTRVQDPLRLLLLVGDSGLLFSEEIDCDGVGVVSLKELLAFGSESFDSLGLTSYFFRVEIAGDVDVFDDMVANPADSGRAHCERFITASDRPLDKIGRQIGLSAAVASLTSEAHDVLIYAAVAFGVDDGESGATRRTEDAALQVVPVLRGLLAADVPLSQKSLNRVEGVEVDDWLVPPFVVDTIPGDDADVVTVVEHVADVRGVEGFPGRLAGRVTAESTLV